MAIFICSNCSHTQDAPQEYVGKKTRCTKCQTIGTVIEKKTQTPEQPLKTHPSNNKISPPPKVDISDDLTKAMKTDKNKIESWHITAILILLGGILITQVIELAGIASPSKKWEYIIQSPEDYTSLREDLETWGGRGWELISMRQKTSSFYGEYEIVMRKPKD